MLQTLFKSSRILCGILAGVVLLACSDGNDSFVGNKYLPIANPMVSLPPDVNSINLLSQNFDLGSVGYQQAEYFLEGTASAYSNISELGPMGSGQLSLANRRHTKPELWSIDPLTQTTSMATCYWNG